MYLLIRPDNAKWWRFDFSFEGKWKTISSGTYPDVSLSVARKKADEVRSKLIEGTNPALIEKKPNNAYMRSLRVIDGYQQIKVWVV